MSELQQQDRGETKRIADADRKRVLVIDDDLPLRGMLAAALRQHGFQVLLAGDGAEGHRALTLHQESGHIGRIRIIVLSAHLHHDPAAVLKMGVSAILPKPFNLPELIELIEHLSP